jgi:hypothetical protein
MRSLTKKIGTVAATIAMLTTPAIASASGASAPAPGSEWATLSELNPAGAVALGASNATAGLPTAATMTTSAAVAQPVDADGEYRSNPLPWPVIGVLLAVVGTMIYIEFIEHHHGHFLFPNPASPQ